MISQGIDFLGHTTFATTLADTPQPEPVIPADALPSALMPLHSLEQAEGMDSSSHRRGRGLAWPPEAQLPVLGEPANGAGRVLMAAAFERLCRAEMTWGRLEDTSLSWRPEGAETVTVDASRLIAAEIKAITGAEANVGLVVPDALGIAGQATLLTSVTNRNLLLVPHSIAVAVAWSASSEKLANAGVFLSYAGYLTVVDVGLGRWSITKVPLRREKVLQQKALIPARFSALTQVGLQTTGASVLTSALGQDPKNMLRIGWQRRILSGAPGTSLSPSPKRIPTSLDSISVLDGNHSLVSASAELVAAFTSLPIAAEYGECLGVIVTGALAQVRFGTNSLKEDISRTLRLPLLESDPEAASRGAALAAQGLYTDLPTWLEYLEPLDLHYIGKNAVGDIQSDWKKILPGELLKAGFEWRNDEPITGLKLQTGRNSVQITIRRPGKPTAWEFRKIETTTGATTDADIPLVINVVARPGQGFAVVRVDSKEAGVFGSQLDWGKLEVCKEPPPPPLAYLVRSVELVVSDPLWRDCVAPLNDLLRCLRNPELAHQLDRRTEDAYKFTRKAVMYLGPNYTAPSEVRDEDLYRLFSPFGRNGQAPSIEGRKLLKEVTLEVEQRLATNRLGHLGKTAERLKRFLAYLRSACPKSLIKVTAYKMEHAPHGCSLVDLLVAGLCFDTPATWTQFYHAFPTTIDSTSRPNAWLKAIRDIVKFNETALAGLNRMQSVALYLALLTRLQKALDAGKPLISQNCFETMLFFLKCRRYHPDFAEPDSVLFLKSLGLVNAAVKSPLLGHKRKLQNAVERFSKFLRLQGEQSDIAGTLMEDEDGDDDGDS